MALANLSALLQDVNKQYSLSNVLGKIPVLHFHSEFNICPECGTVLITQKVKQRTVFTKVYSEIKVKEHIKQCKKCNKKYYSSELLKLVQKHCNYSYDCIVEVGKLRYIKKRQISEIQEIFNNKYDLQISYTQIRRLCYKLYVLNEKYPVISIEKYPLFFTKIE